MKILIYGSTYITQLVVEELKDDYDLVGYVPNKNPVFKGEIGLPLAKRGVRYDIALSIQYDQKIKAKNGFNLHTGLLPEYGGCDILLHTLINKEPKQGLTFHKMTDKFDYGPIISKITYPVFKKDTALDLYKRLCLLAPKFTRVALKLLEEIGLKNVDKCEKYFPIIYKRNNFSPQYKKEYLKSYKEINKWIKKFQ